jgi:glycosyltransferase involved in cell wall biosynthesis
MMVLSLPYPSAPGGAERWMAQAGRALSRRAEVSLHYLVREPENLAPTEAPAVGLSVKRHPYVLPPGRRSARAAIPRGVLRQASAADVVHVNQFGSLTAHLVAAYARYRGVSTFVTDHGSSGVELGRKLGLHRLFDGFLEVSEFAASFGPSARTRVVRGGVDLEKFRPGQRSEQAFALYVGRLLPHKGIDWLLRALPEGARLVVAGRPDPDSRPYLEHLRSLARGRSVNFLIDADDARIAELYRTAWVTVLPSVAVDMYGTRRRVPELFGLSAVEAMASGTPVVVSTAGALPELVRQGETGLIVEQRDVPGLKEILASLLGDRNAVEEIGLRGRAEAEERFSWDGVADRCISAYLELGRSVTRFPSAVA